MTFSDKPVERRETAFLKEYEINLVLDEMLLHGL